MGMTISKLMSNAELIVEEIMDFVMASDSRIDVISDYQIKQVCETIIFFMQALDRYSSGMLTNISHLTDKIAEKTRQYRNKYMEFERYLQLSITPKSHIIEDQSCEQQIIFDSIRDLEESFGEINRQYKSILDR